MPDTVLTADGTSAAAQVERAADTLGKVREAVGHAIFGQDAVIEQTLVTLLAGGHGLLIGVPGLAKTKLVETLGIVLGLDWKRIQFTPDLMPTDIIGSEVLEEDSGKRAFRFLNGPVFTQLLMADEINRASPRTQSALLQAMQERHVTVAGTRYDLPRPFHVLATQNPLEQEGTYPLPEAQLDRFLLQIDVDYPDKAAERRMLLSTTFGEETRPERVCGPEDLMAAQHIVRHIPVGRGGRRFHPQAGARRATGRRRAQRHSRFHRLGSRPARQPGLHACRARPRADRGTACTVDRRCGGVGATGSPPSHGAHLPGARRRHDDILRHRAAVPESSLSRNGNLQYEAEALGASLPPLLVDAERLASAVSLGVHGRRKAGMGESFWQFRRYRPEDSSTAIDWRQSAKSQHLFVREREWEAAQSVWFWCDASPGMQFASGQVTKAERAKLIALALASLAGARWRTCRACSATVTHRRVRAPRCAASGTR